MPTDQMRFASSIAEGQDPFSAAQKAIRQVLEQLEGRPCHAAFLFVSSLYGPKWEPIVKQIRQGLGNPLLLGCTGGGVLGVDEELEFTPALSLAAAYLPRVELHPFKVLPENLEEANGPGFWIENLGASPSQDPVGILLPEPFSCDGMTLVAALQGAYPKMPLIGGLASGADRSGGNALFFDDQIVQEGAVGILLTGDITLKTIVSQGCRPIGRSYIITKAQENVILELAGVPATEALRQLFLSLSEPDRALAQRALFLGIVTDERKSEFHRGDFLIRNLIGIDPATGAIAVGDRIQVGQTVQFQLRDANTSREDLESLLKEQSKALQASPSKGALLFSCLGRGKDLYGEPHYDIRTIRSAIGACPIAGFFCNGEIGPIGGRNFVHGFTSSLGLFGPRSTASSPRSGN